MSVALETDNQTFSESGIIPLLASYQMLPQFWRERIIDQAIERIQCTSEETANACQQFYVQHKLTSEVARQNWLKCHGMNQESLEQMVTRSLKIEKFKQVTWGHKLESYFLSRKKQLDQVIYSLIRVKDMGVAQELYFRIEEREQSFAEVASEYSQGPEAITGGLTGPVELSRPPVPLAEMLSISKPGQIWPPIPFGEWLIILRLEKFIPAQLDEAMRQRLLNELFETWVQKQLEEHVKLMSDVSFF